jgi:hypothetical protein
VWRRVFAERPEDPLPLEWIAAAVVLSIVALVWGWWLGGSAFFQNELAALALLGPGLFLTNVVAVRLQIRRCSADRARRVAATIPTLVSTNLSFWLPVFNAFDQLGSDGWAENWHRMREDLLCAQNAEPSIALAELRNVMSETSGCISHLTWDLGPGELMNIGDTPLPTELLSTWRILISVLNQDVPVPGGLARLETGIAEQQAMRLEARAGDHSLTLSPPDPSLRDNFVTARSYGAVVGALADDAWTVVNELMVDLGMSSRDLW